MPSSDEERAARVAEFLLQEDYVIDNPITQQREFYQDGKMYHTRPREGCGVFHQDWGHYPNKKIP